MLVKGKLRDVYVREGKNPDTGKPWTRYEIGIEVTDPVEIVKLSTMSAETANGYRAHIGHEISCPVDVTKFGLQLNGPARPAGPSSVGVPASPHKAA